MTDEAIEALFHHNADQLPQLNPAAAGLVSSLLDELERDGRLTFIKLKNPMPDGHKVEYDFVEGDRSLVTKAAKQLGFKTVTDSMLEVHSG